MENSVQINGVTYVRADSVPTVARARIALTQPEPEGPTDRELLNLGNDVMGDCLPCDPDLLLAFARAVLARCGRPTPQPISVSERLPGPEDCDEARAFLDSTMDNPAGARPAIVEGPTDEEIADEARKYLVNEYVLPAEITYLLDPDIFEYEPTIGCFRAVLARWGK
jgi:hypothetical protein